MKRTHSNRTVPAIAWQTKRAAYVVLALFCLLANCLGQGTMTFMFEGQPRGTFGTLSGYYESGMHFWNPYGPHNLARDGGGISSKPENGTAYLHVTPGANLEFSFDTFPARFFGLVSIDLAEYDTRQPGPVALQVVGYLGMGGTVTNNFTTDGINDGTGPLQDFQTLDLGEQFLHVYRVDIFGGPFSLDNVLISGVPEPSAGVLALLGATCAFWRSRAGRRLDA